MNRSDAFDTNEWHFRLNISIGEYMALIIFILLLLMKFDGRLIVFVVIFSFTEFRGFARFWKVPWLNFTWSPNGINERCSYKNTECYPKDYSPFGKWGLLMGIMKNISFIHSFYDESKFLFWHWTYVWCHNTNENRCCDSSQCTNSICYGHQWASIIWT